MTDSFQDPARTDDEPDQSALSADDYRQPSDDELAAVAHRQGLPPIEGVSYRCPPAPVAERSALQGGAFGNERLDD
jgi:hypothetical protein